MTIPVTTRSDLAEHLSSLGLVTGDNVVVHSRLISFGLLEGGAQGAYETIRQIVGPRATIAVPTFRLHASAELIYDRRTSPSERCGQLSEFVRQFEGSHRSRCPLHSFGAIGPDAKILEQPSGNSSMGAGSDFEVLHKSGFKQVYLGAEFKEAATVVAHAMAIFGAVPYRQWLNLRRKALNDNGDVVDLDCRYYGRIPGENTDEDWSIPQPLLRGAGKLKECKTHFGRSYAFMTDDLMRILVGYLEKKPDGLLAVNRLDHD